MNLAQKARAAAGQTAQTERAARVWPAALLLFVLALLPRAFAQGGFVTVDEAFHWFDRAQLFLYAFSRRDYIHTNLVGHPGVTTMWLGGLGSQLFDVLAGLGRVAADDEALRRALMRLPVALVASLSVALAYPLLRRLFGGRVALLAALLWATDPFLVAHAQLLHVDALLTSFITLALLTALVAFGFDLPPGEARLRWPTLTASGVCGGLALLTKSPALVLLPTLALIALVAAFRTDESTKDTKDTKQRGYRFSALHVLRGSPRLIILPLLVWGVVAAAVWVALWPAAWVGVVQAALSILKQASDDGGAPHGWGNFFWGQPVSDPGPLFYPVALAFRLTPWTLAGVLLGVLALARGRLAQGRAALALLGLFAAGFLVMMSIPPKKFDRYALPIFPALDLLAAVGLVWLGQLLTRTKNTEPGDEASGLGFEVRELKPQTLNLKTALIAALLALNLLWYHPYELAYYNPLLGGGAMAARLIPVGWGEGYEQAGAFIDAQPDGRDLPVASWFEPVLRPFVAAGTVPMVRALTPGQAGYAVLYIDQLQRRNVPQAIDALYGRVEPAHVVRIHGIDYAYVYQLPPPVARPLDARFGADIRLAGYDLDTDAVRASGALTVTLNWQALAQPPADYTLFIHLLDGSGNVVARADLPPAGPRPPTSAWPRNRYSTALFRIPVPADLPAGRYWLALGLYNPADGARLPLSGVVAPPDAPDDGPEALRLPVELR
ncbi:MAG TPA: glycosyltransferase family 39 protein [Roseiflexaceae bacterium]|nr:glycosyltransferase family 39 protein [Roseiflexaceae bacterium]